MPSRKVPFQAPIYQLKITLEGSEPPIWRRVLVPGNVSLRRLHNIIQVVMNWETHHLHGFGINGINYGEPDPDGMHQMDWRDDKKFTLNQAAAPPIKNFRYIYDFGDSWNHQIEIERTFLHEDPRPYPLCPAGARACPPEDVGGIHQYQEEFHPP
ncbi:MAG: plasmid pRiA4b ORF-3 family protein, partial [Elusimicrobiota bacterium]